MGTIIDALVVTLGFDTKGVDKGAKDGKKGLRDLTDESNKAAGAMAKAAQNAADAFNNLKTEILGVLAAFGVYSGLKDFLHDSTETNAELGRLSTNLGISAKRLDAWRTTAEEMGDSAAESFGALQTVATGVAEAVAKGHSAFTDMARANGVQLQDAQGQWLDYEHTLLAISSRLRSVTANNGPLGRQQAMYLAQQLGVGGMFNELMLGPEDLERRLNSNEQLSRVTDQTTKRAQELQRQWADLRAEFRGTGQDIYTQIAPFLIRLGEDFDRFMRGIDFHKLAEDATEFVESVDWQAFGNWLERIPETFKEISDWIVNLNKESGGWAKILVELTAAWLALDAAMDANPVGLVIVLAAAILALYNDYQVWKSGGKSFIDWKQWKTEIDIAKDAIDALTWSLQKLKEAYDATRSFIGGAAAQRAARINNGTTAEDRRQQGSDANRFLNWLSYLGGYDPKTGQKIPDKDLVSEDDATAQGVKYGTATPTYKPDKYAAIEAANGLPPGILGKMAEIESNNNPAAVSDKGAVGEFQMLPTTGMQYGARSNADLLDPDKEAKFAADYLRDLLKKYSGNVPLALAAYNAGPGAVDKAGGIPKFAETQNYLRKFGYIADPTEQPGAGGAGAPGTGQSNTWNIDKVVIETQATDAQGIMRDMQRRLPNNGPVAFSNTATE